MRFEVVLPGLAFWRWRSHGLDKWAYGLYFGPTLDADGLGDWWHWRIGTVLALAVLLLLGVDWQTVLAVTLLASMLEVDFAPGGHFDRLEVLWMILGPFELNLYIEDRQN